VEGSPAEQAGLVGGDVIIEFGGTDVGNVAQIRQLIANQRAGEAVELKIKRDDKIEKLTAVLGEAKPAYSYSWRTDYDVPSPGFNYITAYDEMREIQEWTERDKKLLDQLREELRKLAQDMKKLSKELEKLKLERLKE